MKVKVIKNVNYGNGVTISQGEILKVRVLNIQNLLGDSWVYQIIEGKHSGDRLSPEFCIEIEEEKLYSEKEWNDLKEHHLVQLNKEREQTATFQVLAREMTEKVKEKNKEIEKLSFILECSKIALQASCGAIETLKVKG